VPGRHADAAAVDADVVVERIGARAELAHRLPVTDTRPCSIRASAARLEATPPPRGSLQPDGRHGITLAARARARGRGWRAVAAPVSAPGTAALLSGGVPSSGPASASKGNVAAGARPG